MTLRPLSSLAATVLIVFVFALSCVRPAIAGEENWSPLLAVRFGNIDALDAEDGDLARFVKNIRNDGRFPPPMRTLVGPEIRNHTFFGISLEGWIECVLLIPSDPGDTRTVWVFPVDNRDEYLGQLASLGLAEYEGMDGVTVLRELDVDGNLDIWYLQWLPGNLAVFGSHRDSVMATWLFYTNRAAARGILYSTGGRFINPDISFRINLPALTAWQDREAGVYWWREKIDLLTRDLLTYWNPGAARQRLVWTIADAFALWPRSITRFDANLWFEPDGIEWQIDADRDPTAPVAAELNLMRSLPDRTAAAVARPVTPASLAEQSNWLGQFLLDAAGGAVTREARQTASLLADAVADGGLRETVVAMVPPPTASPELGGARLVLMNWQIPEQADRTWELLKTLIGSDETVANAFSQMGLRFAIETPANDSGAVGITVYPTADATAPPYYRASWSYRRNGNIVALVSGVDREDRADSDRVRVYRAQMAENAVNFKGDGGADVRLALSRVGPGGASWLSLFEPVRFLQFCLIEAADWRPRSPDQNEPLSTQLAKEILEYSPGRAWSTVGQASRNHWRFDGGLGWDSLSRLAAALGITESMGMEVDVGTGTDSGQ